MKSVKSNLTKKDYKELINSHSLIIKTIIFYIDDTRIVGNIYKDEIYKDEYTNIKKFIINTNLNIDLESKYISIYEILRDKGILNDECILIDDIKYYVSCNATIYPNKKVELDIKFIQY